MADHEQSDYEFANAEEWETAPPKREKTKARKPPPRPQLNQELHEQLITIASEASTVGKWPAQAPHSGHVEHLPAPSGPQDYNRNRGSANAEEVSSPITTNSSYSRRRQASIKYGAFALPPLDMFEPQQDALMDTGPGPSPYGGTPGDVSGVFSPSPSEYGDDTDTTSTQSEEYSEEESEQDISETDDPDQQFPARNGPAVSGFNFLNLADIRERQGSEPDGDTSYTSPA